MTITKSELKSLIKECLREELGRKDKVCEGLDNIKNFTDPSVFPDDPFTVEEILDGIKECNNNMMYPEEKVPLDNIEAVAAGSDSGYMVLTKDKKFYDIVDRGVAGCRTIAYDKIPQWAVKDLKRAGVKIDD